MKTYNVTIKVTGDYTTTVVAENEEEAKEKAILDADDADFGMLEYIDYDEINIEEEEE